MEKIEPKRVRSGSWIWWLIYQPRDIYEGACQQCRRWLINVIIRPKMATGENLGLTMKSGQGLIKMRTLTISNNRRSVANRGTWITSGMSTTVLLNLKRITANRWGCGYHWSIWCRLLWKRIYGCENSVSQRYMDRPVYMWEAKVLKENSTVTDRPCEYELM